MYYTDEKGIQIMIALMKAHGVHKIICSPGSTNISLVASMQYDGSFEMYSCVDERSAAYMACGMSAESGEPVALSCTGATASRNYIPALTEAYYRHLPVLAITSTQPLTRIGHDIAQVIDRTAVLNDLVRMSVQVPVIKDREDEWGAIISINKALLELNHNGGGPVHINLSATLTETYTVRNLPEVRVIKRYSIGDEYPKLNGRIVIYAGSFFRWTDELVEEIEEFCVKYDAVVVGSHLCNYKGKYYVNPSLLCSQDAYESTLTKVETMIHMGDISGDYIRIKAKEVWRIDSDGLLKDPFRKLTKVFEMSELYFFKSYNNLIENEVETGTPFYAKWAKECMEIDKLVPELTFSNIWIAKMTIGRIPEGSSLHLGIYNTLRVWNFFDLPKNVMTYSNTGGFGIDGDYSSAFGASLVDQDKLIFIVAGDLAFFYDINVLGNRHMGNNLRIMLINNGKGTEFRQYNHRAAVFGDVGEEYIAAAGHYGNKSPELVKDYCTDLGLKYLSANNKQDYIDHLDEFVNPLVSKSIIFEVFIDSEEESNSLKMIRNIRKGGSKAIRAGVKNFLGQEKMNRIKQIIN